MTITEGITWVATCTERFDETLAFFRDTLGLEFTDQGTATVDTQFARYAKCSVGEGVEFEILESTAASLGRFPGPIVSFTVDDLDEALKNVTLHGGEVVAGPIESDPWRWVYVRAPDGSAYQMQERRG